MTIAVAPKPAVLNIPSPLTFARVQAANKVCTARAVTRQHMLHRADMAAAEGNHALAHRLRSTAPRV